MIRTYVAGAFLVFLSLAVAGLASSTSLLDWTSLKHILNFGGFSLIFRVALLPTLTIWAVAEATNLWRHPRLFDRRLRSGYVTIKLLTLGIFTALLGAVLAAFALVLLPDWSAETPILLTSAACSAALMLIFTKRQQPGRCHRCGYDLSGLTPNVPQLCTECAAPIM